MIDASLMLVIHGHPKHGKTTLAHTAPAPRLILDAENGSRFVKVPKVRWSPEDESPPEHDGSWESCVVTVRDFRTLRVAYDWLNSGKHPFRSVVWDSITEIQKRCKDSLRGIGEDMTERRWGQLLDQMELLVRDYRDLTMHPTKPIEALIILALTDKREGIWKPLIQGALQKSLPGFVDTIGFLAASTNEDGEREQRLLVSPHPEYEAGDRTGVFPPVLVNPHIERMIQTIASATI